MRFRYSLLDNSTGGAHDLDRVKYIGFNISWAHHAYLDAIAFGFGTQ
ncbi:hypothetical protein [Methanosarcina horonobensis]|nr:hypothetical protein [Methanosarcina horonobensis]